MTKKEMNELSEMKPCKDGCAFCLSKCPECGSVNIGVRYRRFYQLDEHRMKMTFEYSDAKVYCYDCNPEIEDEDPFGIEAEWDAVSEDEKAILKGISSPELAKQLNWHFDDSKPYDLPPELKEDISEQYIEYFADVYTYKNNERNRILLDKEEPYCLNEANFEVFDDLPYDLSSLVNTSYVDLSCEDDTEEPGNHFVINATSIKRVMIRP
jgi:hypothetical protein